MPLGHRGYYFCIVCPYLGCGHGAHLGGGEEFLGFRCAQRAGGSFVIFGIYVYCLFSCHAFLLFGESVGGG